MADNPYFQSMRRALKGDVPKADPTGSPSPAPEEPEDPNRLAKLRQAADAAKQKYMQDNQVDENSDPIKRRLERSKSVSDE